MASSATDGILADAMKASVAEMDEVVVRVEEPEVYA